MKRLRLGGLGVRSIGIPLAVALSAASGVAQAAPYAYAEIQFSNLVLDFGGATVNSSTVTTSSAANYDSSPPDGASAGGDIVNGSDVRESFSGPAANKPGENLFTPQLLNSSGARGDARTSGAISQSGSAADVAEGRLTVSSSTASSSGGTSTGINITITVTSPTRISLSFTASDVLNALTTDPLDGASGNVTASFTVTEGLTTIFNYAPNALNASVSASGENGSQTFSTPDTVYSTFVDLDIGTYQLSLLSGAQERLQTGSPRSTEVPEPASLALLGAGLLGFGLIRRRKRV